MALKQATLPEVEALDAGPLRLAEIASPALRDLYLYWQDKWQGHRMPTRADIEPLEMPALLPLVYLVDVETGVDPERGPLRFRFRLIGTRIVGWFGRDLTGQYVDESFAPRYREAATTGLPLYDVLDKGGADGAPGGRHGFYQRLLMPLAGDDGEIEMLLGGVHPTPMLV